MFALLITEHFYKSDKTRQKLYHRIYESERSAVEASVALAESTVRTQERLNRFSEGHHKFTNVDRGFEIPNVEDFDAAVIFVDGNEGIDTINDATIHIVASYKVVEFTDPHIDGGRVLVR